MVKESYLVESIWLSEILAVQDSHGPAEQQFQSAPVVCPSWTDSLVSCGPVMFYFSLSFLVYFYKKIYQKTNGFHEIHGDLAA